MEITATKAVAFIPMSNDMAEEAREIQHAMDLALGLVQPTAKERAAQKRWAAKQARLKAAGLLDDGGYPKKATDCPVRTTLGNYDSTDDVRCELEIGHAGPHKYLVEWEADDAQ